MKKLLKDLAEGDRIVGWVKRCERCKSLFVSRKDARFCCDACRVAVKRMCLKDIERRLDKAESRIAAMDNSYSSLRPGEPWAS